MNDILSLKEVAKIGLVVAIGIFAFIGFEDFVRMLAH